MAASDKRKTKLAKLQRERAVAERRLQKQVRKAARKQAATHEEQPPGRSPAAEASQPLANQPAVEAATEARRDGDARGQNRG
jgi:hypothetical protein